MTLSFLFLLIPTKGFIYTVNDLTLFTRSLLSVLMRRFIQIKPVLFDQPMDSNLRRHEQNTTYQFFIVINQQGVISVWNPVISVWNLIPRQQNFPNQFFKWFKSCWHLNVRIDHFSIVNYFPKNISNKFHIIWLKRWP